MTLPHWAKLSNKKEKNSIYVVFFSWILLNNINTSEWTEIEREAGTRQGQWNLAADWDISWEAAASKTLQVT